MYPKRTPSSNTKEVLVPADKAIDAYRQWLAKFDAKGWRIDWEAFKQHNDTDMAYAIPSPERRTSKNWVLEEIPRLSAEAGRTVEDEPGEEQAA